MSNDNHDKNVLLLKLLQDAVKHDVELREKFQTGDKFRFIRDRLNALLADVQDRVSVFEEQIERKKNPLEADETLIFVYLYNAQGLLPANWNKLLGKDVFYEYSVNRPIYTTKAAVETFIRNKQNKTSHAYLTIAVKKQDLLASQSKDAYEQELIKVREGSLSLTRLISFTHNNIDYVLDAHGNLKPKTED